MRQITREAHFRQVDFIDSRTLDKCPWQSPYRVATVRHQPTTEAMLMECRPDCGACCTAPSVSSPIPGMPKEGILTTYIGSRCRYVLEINDSPVIPEVLRFRGREALSEPFTWNIEFTSPQHNIQPEQILMKYASFRMRSGKAVHGIITRLEWLSTSADESHYRITLSSRLALLTHARGTVLRPCNRWLRR